MNGLTVGSVFSGVGMLDLGLCLADIDHAWFCEFDDWRREEILTRRFPAADLHKDIRELRADDLGPVDGIVGGFPCKGGSSAGKRNGFEHPETVLWREMFRVIREVRPRYVIVENVANLLGLRPPGLWKGAVWGEVLGDLASLGFHIWGDCIPAAAVGAPHRRDRVFVVAADPSRIGSQGARPEREALVGTQAGGRGTTPDADHQRLEERHGPSEPNGSTFTGPAFDRDGSPTDPQGRRPGCDSEDAPRGLAAVVDGGSPIVADSGSERRQQERRSAPRDEGPNEGRPQDGDHVASGALEEVGGRGVERIGVDWGKYTGAIQRWEQIFGPAPEPLIRRMDDGRALRVDRSRLSALGDGVQVQVGFLVGQFLQSLERGEVTL